ncbi:MAG: hypothetical protein LC808_22870 [Actinobacteria bacterium]|nr:hypothetical protein [Actinomycetota bacterium]
MACELSSNAVQNHNLWLGRPDYYRHGILSRVDGSVSFGRQNERCLWAAGYRDPTGVDKGDHGLHEESLM